MTSDSIAHATIAFHSSAVYPRINKLHSPFLNFLFEMKREIGKILLSRFLMWQNKFANKIYLSQNYLLTKYG
jgi:hypothetical protein